jgi:hypothetical protein
MVSGENMDAKVALYAGVGGLVPHLLRLLAWSRLPIKKRTSNPLKDGALYIGAIIQVALGLMSAELLAVTTALQAAAVGYAAPDVLSRILGSVANAQTPGMSASGELTASPIQRVLSWWKQ